MCRRLGIVGLVSEPWETDWHASTNRDALLPARFRTDEKHVFCSCGLPRGDVGPVQIHLATGRWRGDAHLWQAAIACYDLGNARNAKAAFEFGNRGTIFHLVT